jgi:hypothetical protein
VSQPERADRPGRRDAWREHGASISFFDQCAELKEVRAADLHLRKDARLLRGELVVGEDALLSQFCHLAQP